MKNMDFLTLSFSNFNKPSKETIRDTRNAIVPISTLLFRFSYKPTSEDFQSKEKLAKGRHWLKRKEVSLT